MTKRPSPLFNLRSPLTEFLDTTGVFPPKRAGAADRGRFCRFDRDLRQAVASGSTNLLPMGRPSPFVNNQHCYSNPRHDFWRQWHQQFRTSRSRRH